MHKAQIIVRGFESGNSVVTNVSKWNTQLFLFEDDCGVNALVNLPCGGVG